MKSQTQLNVSSPVSGVIEALSNKIHIYIAPEDDHSVFAPISGEIIEITPTTGVFTAPLGSQFKATPNHTERWFLTIMSSVIPNLALRMYVEVGKPQYITDTINFLPNVQLQQHVSQGEKLGEIVIGSRAVVFFPNPLEGTPVQQQLMNIVPVGSVVDQNTILFSVRRWPIQQSRFVFF